MKVSIKNIIPYLLLLSVATVFFSCKKTELEPESTDLIVKVRDDEGNTIPGGSVQVYLFDDSTEFRRAWQDTIYTGAVANGLLVNSQVLFQGLDPDANYWILMEYQKDIGGGQSVALNNFFTQNTLRNLLEQGATTTVIISLTPYNTGNIAFFSTDGINDDELPIKVYFDGGTFIGDITTIAAQEPTSLDDPNVFRILYQTPGTHTYRAVGNNGCVWEGEVDIESGSNDFAKVNLTGCGFGHVNFWMNSANFTGDVQVTLNDNDEVGSLITGRGSQPGNCDEDQVLRITRPTGKYVYKAVRGTCIWQGTIDINEGCNNTPIEFEVCP